MDIIELEEVGNKINGLDISKFEDNFKVKLPEDYKNFLLKNNGGYPAELLFTPDFIETDPMTKVENRQGTDVEKFLSLNEVSFEYEDILDEDYIPNEYVPIARTSFGNLLLIYVGTEKQYGGVYFANHDLYDSENDCFTISNVAKSFTDFINSLYVDDLEQ